MLAISAAAFAAEIPFFFRGTPSGHDVEFHLYSWLEVLSAWKHGIYYPRWAAQAHFGYGEPRFIFYPPASWTLGASLSAIFPWSIAASIYIWLALVLAGLTMYVLMRRWLDRSDAIFAAVLYAVNPYHLVIVYWRSAFAELLASCLLPLLLLLVVRAVGQKDDQKEDQKVDQKTGVIVPLSLVLAAAWLTNAPAAVMIHYSLGLLIVLLAWHQRAPRLLLVAGTAVALGIGLAAFYLLPAIYEQKWVNIAAAVSAGSRPPDNFLFIHTGDADHDAFNRVVSWVAVLEIVGTLVAAWAAKRWCDKNRALWGPLFFWAAAASLLMFPASGFVWRLLPKLQFMQFPWRWLLCLSLIFSIFITVGLQKWWMRLAVCFVAMLVIGSAWRDIQPPWWDNAADLREMKDNLADRVGYEGVDEYTPLEADPTAIDKDARSVTVDGPAHAAIRVLRWGPESKEFTVQMSAPDQLALRLFRYPAWRVEVNGRVVDTAARENTGQMLVPVEAGMNRVRLTFVRTWDRTVGGWISIVTVSCLILWWFMRRNVASVPVS